MEICIQKVSKLNIVKFSQREKCCMEKNRPCILFLDSPNHTSVSDRTIRRQKVNYNKTEKSFSPIGCSINDHGLYSLIGLFCYKSETRRQDDNSGGKPWGYEAAQLTRSQKIG